MRVGSLFSGIGGLDLGLERAGMSVAWQCEIDPYCRAVLAHHWPGIPCWDDIRAIDESAEAVDLICGGFPCQPVSLAGKGLAQKDPRWVWPEFARVVGLLQPRYVLVENVPGLVRRGLSDVVGDLAEMGYDAEWQIVSAASVGAPHLRERIIVIAYSEGARGRLEGGRPHGKGGQTPKDRGAGLRSGDWRSPDMGTTAGGRGDASLADSEREGLEGSTRVRIESERGPWSLASSEYEGFRRQWEVEPTVGRVADGVSNRVAQLRALGNAVVPQVAEFVGRLILEAEEVAYAC